MPVFRDRPLPEEPLADLSARLAVDPAGRVLVLVVDNPVVEEEYRDELDSMAAAYFSLETERIRLTGRGDAQLVPELLELLKKESEFGGLVHVVGLRELDDESQRAFLTALGRRREELVTASCALILWVQIDFVPTFFESSPDLASIAEIIRPGERRVPVDLDGAARAVEALEGEHGMTSEEFRQRWLLDGCPELGPDADRWLRLLEGLEA